MFFGSGIQTKKKMRFAPISAVLDRFMSYDNSTHRTGKTAWVSTADFIMRIALGVGVFVYILYIIAAAFPAWPLFNQCMDFWLAHLILTPLAAVAISRDAATTSQIYVIKVLALISIALGIRPYIFLIREIYVCGDLTDAEKESLATCTAAYAGNYIDPNSQLACANLVNVDRATLGHGDCAYLIDYVQGAVQAFEFITLVMITYTDMLVYFAAARFTNFIKNRQRTDAYGYGSSRN